MTLAEYAKNLAEFVVEHPEAAEHIVVTSIDNEGNGYNPVYYGPSIGHYDAGEWYTENDAEEHNFQLNAVCLN